MALSTIAGETYGTNRILTVEINTQKHLLEKITLHYLVKTHTLYASATQIQSMCPPPKRFQHISASYLYKVQTVVLITTEPFLQLFDNLKKLFRGLGKCPGLRVVVVLPVLTTTCNSSPRGSDALSMGTRHTCGTQTDMQAKHPYT